MYRDKNGELVFDTEAEVRNFLTEEYSESAIKQKAKERGSKVAIHDKPLAYRTFKAVINRHLRDDPKYRREYQLFNMALDASARQGINLEYTLSYIKQELKWSDDEIRTAWRRGMEVILKWLDSSIIKPTAGEIIKHGF